MRTIFFTLLFSIMSASSAQAEDKNKSIYHKDVNIYLDVDVEKLSGGNIIFQAFKLSRDGRKQGAIEFCDKVLRYNPHSAEAHFGKGWALTMLDRDEEAVNSYSLAIKYKYKLIGWVYYYKCRSLAKLNRLEEALEACELAIKHEYEDQYVRHTRESLLIDLGRF